MKITLSIATLFAILLLSVNTFALSFNDTITFDSTYELDPALNNVEIVSVSAVEHGVDGEADKDVERDAVRIKDTGNYSDPGSACYIPAFTYTHNVGFNPAAESIDSATLEVTYTGNLADKCIEAWFIADSSNNPISLGYLEDTQGSKYDICQDFYWATSSFDLSAYIAGVSGDSWSIQFIVDENTWRANEVIYLAESTLKGTYTEEQSPTAPVPEPTTLLLLSTGLIGFTRFRKKKNR